ncbi:hypothetical protein KSP40_PGU005434 [Platanthera guangdongensis]|uniref:Uncharacterized protein n=1 Tax=Platanthera guangdongensis TaxID=2320717 RepID=A0ABR2MW98_9ASPA
MERWKTTRSPAVAELGELRRHQMRGRALNWIVGAMRMRGRGGSGSGTNLDASSASRGICRRRDLRRWGTAARWGPVLAVFWEAPVKMRSSTSLCCCRRRPICSAQG